jgi:putative ABC transport system permease protein
VSARTIRVPWYHFRATIHQRWIGYLSIVLLIGLVGGVAMVSIAGARRSQSTFGAYLAATRASDLQFQTSGVSDQFGITTLSGKLARLPHVEHVADAPSLLVVPLGANGKALPSALNDDDVTEVGSAGGMYYRQDRVIVTQGQMADPASTNEMVATAEAARLSGWHIGQTVTFGAYSIEQAQTPSFNPLTGKPWMRFSAKLVGLVVFSSQVVDDDVDRFPTDVLMTPALTKKLSAAATYPTYGLRLDSDRAVPDVEREIVDALPPGSTYSFHLTSVVEGQVERATRPEAIALGVFGVIAALAALLIGGQAISRQLWANRGDLEVLRSLGAARPTMAADATLGPICAVLLGACAAVGVAVALSPLTPIGPASPVDPSPGVAFDWTVLSLGFAVLVLGLGGLTLVLAYREATQRHEASKSRRRSSLVEVATRSGLPEPAIAGLRFSFERGSGRTAVPVRSALLGAVLAVTVVVATLTFGSSLATLNSQPALYGWNWSYAINSPATDNVPPVVGTLLSRDPAVAAWTGYTFGNVRIDGLTVPTLLTQAHAALGPPILSGHAVDENDQVVLGSATLAALHKKVGDTVFVSYGAPKDAPVYIAPTPLLIVGTATMPAIGVSGHLHTSMGTGALLPTGLEPAAFKRALAQPDPNQDGPAMDVVRFKNGVTPSVGQSSLRRIVEAADKVMAVDPNGAGDTYALLSVQRPAEIVNYQATGSTPGVLAAGLAAGAIVALGLTLAASVRRRRRDLALLKTFGFTRRQLAAAVAWQASVAAIVGIIVGVPVGIALGRWLWDLFARDIYAVPLPTVPVLEVILVALGALVLANVVAAIPGQMAARTPTALVLRAE